MAFEFLKKLFGCSSCSADAPRVDTEKTGNGEKRTKRHFNGSDDNRAAGKPARRRDAKPRREASSPREPRETLSNLSPEQKQEALDKLNAFVLHVAQSLVNFPDQVSTALVNGEDDFRTIMISCAQGDAGKLIGRNGKIIASIRTLVSCNAARSGMKVTVDIQD